MKTDIEKRMSSLAKLIKANPLYLPSFGTPRYDGHPFILQFNGSFHYIIQEGNEEHKRLIFSNSDDLLYEVFKEVTFLIAIDFELNNRKNDQDSRRVIFEKQKDLFSKLNSIWQKKMIEEQEKIIDKFPFID